jgi:hypothetical protein
MSGAVECTYLNLNTKMVLGNRSWKRRVEYVHDGSVPTRLSPILETAMSAKSEL